MAGDYPHDSMYLLQHVFNNWFRELSLDKMAAGGSDNISGSYDTDPASAKGLGQRGMTGMKKVIFVVLGIFALAAAYPVLFLLAGSLMESRSWRGICHRFWQRETDMRRFVCFPCTPHCGRMLELLLAFPGLFCVCFGIPYASQRESFWDSSWWECLRRGHLPDMIFL